ncbi:hypothetical protein PINS_up017777 [Pythium insidiosum]|nr:hypothetical protein PINS_up017777 [Pythium insidiosum]
MCEAVLRHLQLTWELTPHDLALIAKTLQVENKVMEDVHRQLNVDVRPSKKQRTMLNSNNNNNAEANAPQQSHVDGSTRTDSEDASEKVSMAQQMRLYEKAVDSYRCA